MLPQKIPKPEKKKLNIHRYLLATIFATLIGLAGLVVYRKFRSRSEILDDEFLVTGDGLNVSAVITDEITREQFSFDDVLNGKSHLNCPKPKMRRLKPKHHIRC